MSHDPSEITRSFKTHCFKCGTWNQVTVHRVPTDGDWDEAHPYICAGANSALNEASVFPSRRIAITDSHSGPGDAATSDGTGPINVATPSFRTRAIQSSGSETLLRIQFLAGCTIGMLESCIRKRQPGPDAEIEPCLPSPVERPPAGADWIHEIKHDGFRLVARRGAERVRLFTRNGNDWSERFPLIVEALNAIKATTCLIDGEAVTCSEAGLADFDGLRNRRGDVHLCAFDLVELDGRDLRLEPLTPRRRLLAQRRPAVHPDGMRAHVVLTRIAVARNVRIEIALRTMDCRALGVAQASRRLHERI